MQLHSEGSAEAGPQTNRKKPRDKTVRKAADLVTAERLKSLLHYDRFTGEFTWLVDRSRTKAGDPAGRFNRGNGYREIGIDGRRYQAQRLAWLYCTGQHPENLVDHRNRIKTDNRWFNLRASTKAENGWNAKKWRTNTSGFKNVFFCKRDKKWFGVIAAHGKQTRIGYGKSKDEVIRLVEAARPRIHGDFARSF